MEFSLGKTLWRGFMWLFEGFIKLFFIFDTLFFIFILLQVKPNVEECKVFFFSFITVLSVACFFPIFPTWIQGILLWLYFTLCRQLIVKLISSGTIDYNFVWSLPKGVNDLIGIPIKGTFVDFVFWSGFIVCVIFFIDRLERRFFIFLAKTIKIEWANELLGESLNRFSKSQHTIGNGVTTKKTEEIQVNKMTTSPLHREIKEKIIFKPKFFKDRLWYLPFYFLLTILPVGILFFFGGGLGPFPIIFGCTALLTFLIFYPFFLWESTTRIILEKDKFVVKTFYIFKKEFYYRDIKNIVTEGNYRGMETLIIFYEKETKDRRILKNVRLFLWPYTIEKVLEELQPRLENITINDSIIKRIKTTRSVSNAILLVIIIGLFVGFLYFIIYQAKNRPRLSDQACAKQLGFWISDKQKVGIQGTKEGFKPELNMKLPFYLFIDAQKSFSECEKNISLTINNSYGNIIFQKESLTTPKKGISYYYWNGIIKEPGNYILNINYDALPEKKIEFLMK